MSNKEYEICKRMVDNFTTKRNKDLLDTQVVAFGELIKVACIEIERSIDVVNVFNATSSHSKQQLKLAKSCLDRAHTLLESYRTHMDNSPVQIMLPNNPEYWNFIFYGADNFSKTEEYRVMMDIDKGYSELEYLLVEIRKRVLLAFVCIMKASYEASKMFGKGTESYKILDKIETLLFRVIERMEKVACAELNKLNYNCHHILNEFYRDQVDIRGIVQNYFDNIIESNFLDLFKNYVI